MSPNEEIPPEVLPRAYFNQAVWKRVVVIVAGPAVNIALAIVIIWVLLLASGEVTQTVNRRVASVDKGSPAAHVLRPGDTIVSVDGVGGSVAAIHRRIESHKCAGTPRNGCRAATPAQLVVRRHGRLVHLALRPRHETVSLGNGQTETGMLIGIEFGFTNHLSHPGVIAAGADSVTRLWSVSKQTVSAVVRIFEPKERKQLHGVVGTYDYTAKSFSAGAVPAFGVIALISLSLGIINLFPFLPLDGGHVFWAVAEKLRGKRIPFAVMERAGVVGFVLILALFVIGLSNDITGLSNGTFNVR
jgi:regulator of sigma E protease